MSEETRVSELLKLLDIEFDEITATRVSGSVGADELHHQPWGIVHGGPYTTVIESAFEALKDRGQQAIGVSDATDFLRPHRTGRLRALAVPGTDGDPARAPRVGRPP